MLPTGVTRQLQPRSISSSGERPPDCDWPSVPNVTGWFAALAVGRVGDSHAAPTRAHSLVMNHTCSSSHAISRSP